MAEEENKNPEQALMVDGGTESPPSPEKPGRPKMTVQAKAGGGPGPKSVKAKAPDMLPPRVDVQVMDPGKYEVTKDQTFKVKVHLRMKDDRWTVMAGEGPETDDHEVVFRMWTYDEQVDLKKKSTTFDGNQRVHMIDNDALNQLKVMKFLLSWTFDRDNARLKLHRVQGALTDESWEVFKRLQQNIIAYILGEMNQVYEWNG